MMNIHKKLIKQVFRKPAAGSIDALWDYEMKSEDHISIILNEKNVIIYDSRPLSCLCYETTRLSCTGKKKREIKIFYLKEGRMKMRKLSSLQKKKKCIKPVLLRKCAVRPSTFAKALNCRSDNLNFFVDLKDFENLHIFKVRLREKCAHLQNTIKIIYPISDLVEIFQPFFLYEGKEKTEILRIQTRTNWTSGINGPLKPSLQTPD